MSSQNLLPRANSAYVSVTDKSTVTPAYPLTMIQDCTFSPISFLSIGVDRRVVSLILLISTSDTSGDNAMTVQVEL